MCPTVARSDRSQSVRVPLRVLIAEDSEDDARLLLRELQRAGFDPAYERVDSPTAMQAALDRQAWDLVIGDYSMPAFSGPAALALLRACDLDTPFIFVSGTIGEDVAVEAMKAGAQDFLTKGNLRRLIPAIERELRDAEVRRERRRAQTALLERARLAELTSDVGIALTQGADLRAMLQLCAEALVRHLDVAFARIWTLDDASGMLELQASAGMYTHIDGAHSRVPLGQYKIGLIARERRPHLTNQVVGDPQVHDQAWARRERLVAFAGYPLVVHDRVLGVMAMVARHALSELEPKALDLTATVTGTEKLLKRLIGGDVQLGTSLAPDLGAVKADPGQLEQIIINLAVNARDAMPTGGRLTIETANMEMDEAYVRSHAPARPGRYVMLALSDTGIGMDEQTKARIFEPFFTTKESGKGTGLGLATVYGIVKQAGGFIWVYSEPGRGTSFKVYLPRVDETPEPVVARPATAEPRGSETVLVVEDAAAVRMVTRQVLDRYGYAVLEAPNGDTALRLAAKHHGPIHLLLTDVIMPGLSGRELAEQLAQLRPDMKVLYVSGYADNAMVHHGILESGVAYLQKPFTPETLARRVRDVLDA